MTAYDGKYTYIVVFKNLDLPLNMNVFFHHLLYPEYQLTFLPKHQTAKLAIICYFNALFIFQNALELSPWHNFSRCVHTEKENFHFLKAKQIFLAT